MGSGENGGGGQHPAAEGRQIGTPPPPGMFMTPSLNNKFLHEFASSDKVFTFSNCPLKCKFKIVPTLV